MNKIVIIGSPGAGKSTLARKLGSILNIKVVHLDRIFWQRGWKEKPKDTKIDILQDLVREKRWIIEGTYFSSSEPRLNAADTIIFLDIDPLLCLHRIINRHREYHGRSRRDIPQGCTDKLTLFLMFKVLVFPFQERRALEEKLCKFPSEKVIRLRSVKEVEVYQSIDGVPFTAMHTRRICFARSTGYRALQGDRYERCRQYPPAYGYTTTRRVLVSATFYYPEQTQTFMRQFTTESRTSEDWQFMRQSYKHDDEHIRAIWMQGQVLKGNYDDMNFTAPYLSTIAN